MINDGLPEEWEILRAWLPEDLDALAQRSAFFQRQRGLTDGEKWLLSAVKQKWIKTADLELDLLRWHFL